MRDHVTFCIKTIHRPLCCAALVRSIHEHCGRDRPAIHVLDDGQPELRFSKHCPQEAALVDQLIETEYDIGLSAGRNRLLDAGHSPLVIFTDDDHLVTEQTRLPELVSKFQKHDVEILAALSKKPSHHQADGQPRLLKSAGGVVRIPPGYTHRQDSIHWCDFVSNCFLAYRDILQAIRWDESLKVEEHWDFFWRCKVAGVKVAVATDHLFEHRHIDPPHYIRHRPECLKSSLEKHGIRKVVWK